MKKYIKILFLLSCFAALLYYYLHINADQFFIYAAEHDSVPLVRLAIFCNADAKAILENNDRKYKYNLYPNRNVIEFLIKSYPDDLYPYNILEKALKDNSLEIVKVLADNCNFKDNFEYSFYQDAVACAKDPEIFELLGTRGLDISEAVIKKIYNKEFRDVKGVLEKTKKINVKVKSGLTPLMCAVINRDCDAFKFLIDNEADVNAEYSDGDTPLFMALRNSPDFEMAKTLIEKGASVDKENKLNECPLEILMDRPGNEEIIKFLIEKGASDKNKFSAIARLKNTGLSGYASIIEAAIPIAEKKTPTEIQTPINPTINKDTAVSRKDEISLMSAVESGLKEEVKALIEAGADINVTDSIENTLLMKAAETKNNDLLLLLTDCGADVNARNLSGETALIKLAKNINYIDLKPIKCLLKAGTDVSIKDYAGNNALHYLVGKYLSYEDDKTKIENLFYLKYKSPASREIYKKREKAGYNKISFQSKKIFAFDAAKNNNLESLEIYFNSLLSLEDFDKIYSIACKNNNLEMIKFLIGDYEDIIYHYYDIQRFISTAISGRYDRRILSYLLKQTNHVESHHINSAVLDNDIELLDILIEKSLENKEYNYELGNSIMLAVELGNQEAVKILAKKMKDKDIETTRFNFHSNDKLPFNPHLSTNSMFKSILKDQSGITKIFVDNMKNIDKKFCYGFTALSYAAWYGKNDLVSYILKKGADPNLGTDDGTTPLMYASMAGHTESIELLIKGRADINKKNANGIDALCEALMSYRTEAVELLKSRGADLNEALNTLKKIRKKGSNINFKDSCGNSMLAKAAFEKDFLKAKYLIDHGAKVNDFTGMKTTILGAAIVFEGDYMIEFSYELVKLLLDRGADPYYMNNASAFAKMIKFSIVCGYDPVKDFIVKLPASLNISSFYDLLSDAIEKGKNDWADLLILAGIDFNERIKKGCNNYSEPIFFSSVINNDHNMLEYLIKKGINVNARTNNNFTSEKNQRHYSPARLCDSLDYENGCVITGRGWYQLQDMPGCGGNALFFISDRPYYRQKGEEGIKTLELLIKAGCEINGRNDLGYTPLSINSMRADRNLIKAMIDHGADVNAMSTDELKITPIFGACANKNDPGVIDELLDRGADVNQTAQDNWTPLMFAVRARNPMVVELLIKRGAGVNALNSDGMTALDLAYLYCYWKDDKNINIFKKLKAAGAVSKFKKYDFEKVFN